MTINIGKKLSGEILRALEAGVVPIKGIRYLLVGRTKEVQEIVTVLDSVESGESDLRIWVGDFGSGKSFMLRTIENLAIQKNFVSSTVDLTPTRRFYATDGKARALYQAIVDNLMIKSSQNGGAIQSLFQEAINNTMQQVANENELSIMDLFDSNNKALVQNKILEITQTFESTGLSFEMGQSMNKYYEGLITNNQLLQTKALRWIQGDIRTKTEAKKELGINKIIDDDNWYDALKSLSELFNRLGYSGLVVNFDEAVNLYKLPRSTTRERNYERILNIYNDCKTGYAPHLFVNFGATRKTVFDEYRGMSSYGALKGRLGSERDLDSKLINMSRTALRLRPLNSEEIFTLLETIKEIFDIHHETTSDVKLEDIHFYMEEQLNRPGADEFLTPRAVIKEFLEILHLTRQNPEFSVMEIINMKFGNDPTPVEKDKDDTDDEIETEIEVF
ncbi:ATP-binding protein [Aerococcaceae bacterium DSM 111176]|nr:ATP-binding protein [Aerococcaceae bacterium DSM 111176]